MPLYSDSNYYYSGGSSQLYSPYYTPGSYGNPTQTTSVPYTSSYSRPYGGGYVVPLAPPRSPTYTSTHGLSSRYQPNLCSINETLPLIGGSRHTSLMPLTRIQSPKFSGYTSPSKTISTVGSSRYIPPRPISINTADLDVSSSSRYRKHRDEEIEKEEAEELETKKQKEIAETTLPTTSSKKRLSSTDEEKHENDADQNNNSTNAEGPDRKTARSTIKRNRAVVRLSTIRSRSKDRSAKSNTATEKASPETNRNKFRDLPHAPEEKVSWRQKLAEDLAAIPVYPVKKSPGDLIRERYLIQEENKKDENDTASSRRAERMAAGAISKITEKQLEEVVVNNTIRRLSIPACPNFHDICEDISSDKIDDDLNAGELRRRASLIQEQEQDLLNQLQNSPSGTIQFIHLEREGSHDSVTDESPQRQSVNKRKSKKGKKIRHTITAIVDVENAPLTPIPQEKEEDQAGRVVSPKPKFTVNVESVEEHHEIHKIFKLPKKKSIKKSVKPKDVPLPEGFVQAKPKAKISPESKMPKKQTFISTAEIFTFENASMEIKKSENMETEKLKEVKIETNKESKNENGPEILELLEPKVKDTSNNEREAEVTKLEEKTPIPLLKSSNSLDADAKTTTKIFEKSQFPKSEEIKSFPKEEIGVKIAPNNERLPKPLSELSDKSVASKKIIPVLTSSMSLDTPKSTAFTTKKVVESKQTTPHLTSSASFDVPKSTSTPLEKSQPFNVEEPKPKVATPKPIRKIIQKSESGEDFWTQMGSRETLYMTNRKKVLVENQWQKSEDLLESEITEEVKNLENIKTVVIAQKEEALQKARDDFKTGDKGVAHSHSNESSLAISEEKMASPKSGSSPKKGTARKKTAELVVELAKLKTDVNKPQTAQKPTATSPKKITRKKTAELQVELAIPKTEIDMSKTTPTATPSISSPKEVTSLKKTTELSIELEKPKTDMNKPKTAPIVAPTIKTAQPSTTTPKINSGQEAKSPEKQQNKFATTTATAATRDNNIDKTPINNTNTSATSKTANAAAKISELATVPTTSVATTAANQQPETKAKQSTTEADKKSNADLKSPIDTTKTSDKTKVPATKTKLATTAGNKTSKIAPNAAKAKTSPIAATNNNVAPTINADGFISVAPVKTVTSPTKTKNASPAKTMATAASATTTVAATTTLTDKVVKASATATSTTTIASTPTATTTTTSKSAAPVATTAAVAVPTSDDNSDTRGDGNNLSKFATVSNLAQYLQDVDADLEEYIPSSANNSDDDLTDVSTDDISSADGWENLSASMKKKLKLRRKKEKLAERARFDPKKKITIDPTNKCYVKEEAPRFPLVATPRPLWKREKVVYPSADTDDSDSDESGSTEETEDSDECSTSEDYEDELNPSGTASPATTTTANSSSTASKENSSIIRMSTCSNDSGFEGGTAPSSPKKMLECDVNCHKKCERLTANMCGVNQKLIVEALAYVKRGTRETRDSPSTPPSLNPAYKIEPNDEHDETSYTYSQFQKSGRFTAPATVIPRFKNYTVDDFHFLTVLGKGSFGKVLLAELRETTYYYAVKCLKKDVVLEDDDVDSTLIERKVLALGTKHPYLCHLFCTFQTESHLFFVMEYLNGGDLMFHIQESGRFSEERARFYGAEIISGLKFLHKKGIIYRDLKLDNVLLDYEGHVRIADFGMCKLQIYLDKTADSFCGTPDYMAPEIVKGEKYNQNVDWWSFGVLLYEMLIGQSPFSGCDEDELFWSICNEIPWFPVYISAEATGILKGLLEKDYMKRIGSQYSVAGDLSDHIFFRPIDWNLLEKRQLEPPFRPQVKHPLDTQYFDRVFTRERVRLTPIDKEILQSMDQKQFHGFTYTNPHITLD